MEKEAHLVYRYYRGVVQFFRQRGFSSEDSLDLAQDTFLQVYRRIDGFRGEAEVGTWIYQIALNVYKQTLRVQSAQKRPLVVRGIDGLEEIDLEGVTWLDRRRRDPLNELLLEELSRFVHDTIGELPPQMRRATFLRYNRGLKYREIADVMRISIDTVKAHLFQARAHLWRKLR
jgi:RNA polymerase sigma-70 factor (ECF subfamily)